MLRSLGFLVLLAALTGAAVWLADRPGEVAIEWQGYAVSTSVGVLVLAVAAIAVVWALVYHFWRWLRAGPRRLLAGRAARRRERGYRTLTEGLVAVAAGDARSAQRFGRESAGLIDNPLNLLLLAQAAQLGGNEHAARRHFVAMLDHPETEFLGLRGLLVQATKAGDWEAALGYARRAHALRPGAEWASSALFDLEVRAGDWRAAQKALESAARHHHVSAADAPRRRAVLLAARALDAHAQGRDDEALALAREAHKHAPGLVAVTALAARLLIGTGKRRAAARLIEEGWTVAPHPELAAAHAALAPDERPMQRLKRLEGLVARKPGHPEGRIALAEAALAAEVWGAARRELEAVADERPTQRVFGLLATLEEGENGDEAAARAWLWRATSAPPDAAWICEKCGAVAAAWGARCTACNAFDSLVWKVPPAPVPLATPAEPERLTAAAEDVAEASPLVVDAVVARE
ncbi:MAG: heme biosynthesis protein HemY [Alphaproteobacteria bacterium]